MTISVDLTGGECGTTITVARLRAGVRVSLGGY